MEDDLKKNIIIFFFFKTRMTKSRKIDRRPKKNEKMEDDLKKN